MDDSIEAIVPQTDATADVISHDHNMESAPALEAIVPQTDATADILTHSHGLTSEAAPSRSSLIAQLAETISRESAIVDGYFRENGGAQPGFEEDSLLKYPQLPDEIERARQEVLRASSELKDLMTGPSDVVRLMGYNYNDQTSLNALIRFKILEAIPVGSTATFSEISAATNLSETNVKRIIYHTITNRILREVSPGHIAHTSHSYALVSDPVLRSWVNMNCDEIMTASVKLCDTMEKYPNSEEMTQTAFQVANGTENIEPLFATIGKDPRRAKRFGEAMSSLANGEGYEVHRTVELYDWDRIDAKSGVVVDVGGSHGFVCVAIAEKYKNIRFVVQDLPRTVTSAPKLEADLAERIKFEAHDFNTLQPVKGADVYFFRWIFHNQPTKYAINLIRQLIPALKRGASVVINDHVLPTSSGQESLFDEKQIRTMDMIMITLLNAMERTEEMFRDLFAQADPAFRFVGVTRKKGYRMALVEAVWEGEDFGGADVTSDAREN